MKLKEILQLDEASQYFIKILFMIDYGWYNNPDEIVKSMFNFAPKDVIQRAEIEYKGVKPSNNPKKYVYLIKIITPLDKKQMNNWLMGNTTKAEAYKIL